MRFKPFWTKERTHEAATETGTGADATPAAPPAEAPAESEVPEASTGPDLAFIPEAYRDENGAVDLDGFSAHYNDLVAEQARLQEAQGLIPEEYDFAVPEDLDLSDFNLPEGFAFQVDPNDEAMKPLLGELGSMLKEMGAPAEMGPKVMALLAKHEATHYARRYEATKADLDKLGATDAQRGARIDRVARAAQAKLPADQFEALMGAATSSSAVRALETLLAPRGAGPTQPSNTAAQLSPGALLSQRYPNSN